MPVVKETPTLRTPVQIRHSKILKEIAEAEQYTVVGDYLYNAKKVEFLCNKQHTFMMTPNDFKKGTRCPACALNRIRISARREGKKKKKGQQSLLIRYSKIKNILLQPLMMEPIPN